MEKPSSRIALLSSMIAVNRYNIYESESPWCTQAEVLVFFNHSHSGRTLMHECLFVREQEGGVNLYFSANLETDIADYYFFY